MIELALAVALATSFQNVPISEADREAAAIALRATIDAVNSGRVEVECNINSLYREDEPCDAPAKNVRALVLEKLVRFEITRCFANVPPTRCAEFLFDRGRDDGGVTHLEVATVSGKVLVAADVKTIAISQFILPRD